MKKVLVIDCGNARLIYAVNEGLKYIVKTTTIKIFNNYENHWISY